MRFRYMSEEIPSFRLPTNGGQRYEALVPATFDVQERAALAVRGLTGITDPEKDYEVYWWVTMGSNPPYMTHRPNDLHNQVAFHSALPLVRLMSGSDHSQHIEEHWAKVLLHMRGPEGLLWTGTEDRPWLLFQGGATHGEATQDYADVILNGWALAVMALYHRLTGDRLWRDVGQQIVSGLAANVVDKGSYAYFPQSFIPWSDPALPIPHRVSHGGWVIYGLTHFFRETGYEPALELAGKLARAIKDHANFFGPNGEFLDCQRQPFPEAHFYAHVHCLFEILDYALAAGGEDRELIDFAKGGYAYARESGNTILGFFPELLWRESFQTCETCGLADLISMGLRLAAIGEADHWDDVDRWIRNQFAENQIMRPLDWADRLAWRGPDIGWQQQSQRPIDPVAESADRVSERVVGMFRGWPEPSEGLGGEGRGVMPCCTIQGARALYYIWEHMVSYRDGTLSVHLLLNRPSPWADVASHIPYQGQVDIAVKQDLDLEARMPEWVAREQVSCTVDGQPRDVSWRGAYVRLGPLAPGASVSIRFPITERAERIHIQKRAYSVVRRGSEVVAIEPPGTIDPLYQRSHYRDGVTLWKNTDRFVPNENLYW